MIVELILNMIFGLFSFIISLFPTFVIDDNIINNINNIINVVSKYTSIANIIIDVKIMFICISAIFIVQNFKFITKTILRIWDALPFT